MQGFGQFCPVALAAEALTPKWTLLIVRELAAGSSRFSDLRRGVPRISASLLKQRLDALEHAGVVERRPTRSGAHDYVLTQAGLELQPVLAQIGAWGQRWGREIETADLDPQWLVWTMHRRLDVAAMPGRTVIQISFTDMPPSRRNFWLVCHNGEVDVCLKPPGFEVNVCLRTTLRILAEVWRGLRSMRPEIVAGRITLEGEPGACRALPDWLLLSTHAAIARAC